MHSNASGFMIGGGETTSTTLSGVVYLLLRHPEAIRKLMDELRGAGVFDRGDDRISWSTLARLKYLNACLTETLRLFHPAAVGLPRIVPPGGAKICGNVVPEGVDSYAAGHSPLNFYHADKFRPARWFSPKTGSDMFAGDRKDAIHPFSYGPRNCIGKSKSFSDLPLQPSPR
ncbi:putative sterigmatocystin biosynthesis P450 monooxygenase stcF [Madurella mycetomatis]|uniref:Sterigmatocystin biosynthesis P450 monooxygenase stcF n=1 Tax=Madurella mycetomatis TaxID=100816 RepID=A0A175WDA8_9PEZI|nr:putative sterigmatocystin biosynthesis P450 monooxygenase stcF [Madurella mycetomatis]